ncbi:MULTISPECIES: hypothetical protein [unclassified Microbulbifer]|uniref:hypothetical protein n=1 Tax=unclassified Microbulbifer TaxID=2619833 RepID=UPI0027E54DF9|nr:MULTISPECIES: hypothetical protein [unclassified Microbulbifer]
MNKLTAAAGLSVIIALAATSAAANPGKGGSLPPGLEKKAQRGGELPPGWKKKLQKGVILEPEIYRHGVIVRPVDEFGFVTIRIEGELVRLVHATHEIVDILSH